VEVKWEKFGDYAIKTKGYSISKSWIDGAWLYTLWRFPAKSLGNYRKLDDAKKAHLETVGIEQAEPDSIDSGIGLQKTRFGSGYSALKG